jgi:hypothetical protein
MSGRKRSSIWDSFRLNTVDGKRRATCLYCNHEINADAKRMQLHLVKHCLVVTDEVKEAESKQMEASLSSEERSGNVASSESSLLSWLSSLSTSSHTPKNGSSTIATRKLNDEYKTVHDNLVKGCIYGNIPWASFFDNPYFQDAFSQLQPNFRLISRKVAASTVLNRLFDVSKSEQNQSIKDARAVTIICDSVTDCTRKNITNWIVADERRRTYLMDVESSLCSKTANEVYEQFVLKVKKFNISPECIVHHCSDSVGVYFKTRQLMKSNLDSPVTLTCGCMAHMTNLFLKDFMNSVSFVSVSIQFVVDIAVVVSRSTVMSAAILKELKDSKAVRDSVETFALNIPTKTRWYSNGLTVKQGLKVRQAVQLAFIRESDEQYFKRSNLIKKCSKEIQSDKMWSAVKATDCLLSPFNFATAMNE